MRKFDLILLAGGEVGSLVKDTGYSTKALIPIHGKPMLEWVIDAFRQSESIRHIVVAGPPELDRLPAMLHVRRRVSAGRSLLQSFMHAALYIKARLHRGDYPKGFLVSCCDAVFLTPEVIEAAVANIRTADPDIALHYVERGTYDRVGLDVQRTFIPVGDKEYTGTTIYYVRKVRSVVMAACEIQKVRKYRKDPAKLLALLGVEPRSLGDVQRIISARLSIKVSIFVLDRPEAGMDVDKPADLEFARRWLTPPGGQLMGVMEAVRARRSIRNYRPVPLAREHATALADAVKNTGSGPFGGTCRFKLLKPTRNNPGALKGLTGLVGTYGFINNAQAFVVGAAGSEDHALEDFGYLMESLVLKASALGVTSCWLGGAFRRERFSKVMGVTNEEHVPAVVSLGYDLGRKRFLIDDVIERHHCYKQKRKAWESIFFGKGTFGSPLARSEAGPYLDALDAVRLAPSSCNTQTWRIIRESGQTWHVFFQRNIKYSKKDHLIGNADLQRIDTGIAMCHFEMVARDRGLAGQWRVLPDVRVNEVPNGVEYVASWCEV